MTRQGYAVDVGWLITQDSADAMTSYRVLHAFVVMQEMGLQLLMDTEGHITGEYERNLKADTLGRKIYSHAVKANMISYFSGRTAASCNDCLDQLGFDPSDRPYIVVAKNAGDGAYVTHEEKHIDPERAAAIHTGCGIDVLSTDSFFLDLAV